jgi:DNA repair protein RadC
VLKEALNKYVSSMPPTKEALALNAAAHNHPSGLAQPREADGIRAGRLKLALNLVDIRALGHFIVGAVDSYSFAEHM